MIYFLKWFPVKEGITRSTQKYTYFIPSVPVEDIGKQLSPRLDAVKRGV